MSGNIAAQIITLGIAPVITRLFTPENFGTLALFTAFTMVFTQVGSLCYERAILLPKNNSDAWNILLLSFGILVCVSIIIFVICIFFNESIAGLLNNNEISFWILFLPVGVFLSGAYKIYRFWSLRQKQFAVLAKSRVIQAVVTVTIKVSAGVIIGGISGWLIGSFIIGFLAALIYLVFVSGHSNIQLCMERLDVNKVKRLANKYRQFPLFASLNALINFASQNMAVFMLSSFFSPAVVGFYSLGNRVLRRPIITLAESVQNAYFQKSAQQKSNNIELRSGFIKTTTVLFGLGIIPFSVLMFGGKTIFVFLFGTAWETAGTYVQIMTPWFFLLFISSPGSVVFEVCNKQDLKLKITIMKGLLRFLGLFVGCAFLNNPVWALTLYILVSVVFELLTMYVSYNLL